LRTPGVIFGEAMPTSQRAAQNGLTGGPGRSGQWEPSPWADEEDESQTIAADIEEPGIKSLCKSRTFWYGVCVTAMSSISLFQEQALIQASPQAVSIIGIAMGVGTIVLRLLTNGPVRVPQVIIRKR
jgi:hypothetical protein